MNGLEREEVCGLLLSIILKEEEEERERREREREESKKVKSVFFLP